MSYPVHMNHGVAFEVDIGIEQTDVVTEDKLLQRTCFDVTDLDQLTLECNDVRVDHRKGLCSALKLNELALCKISILCHRESEFYGDRKDHLCSICSPLKSKTAGALNTGLTRVAQQECFCADLEHAHRYTVWSLQQERVLRVCFRWIYSGIP